MQEEFILNQRDIDGHIDKYVSGNGLHQLMNYRINIQTKEEFLDMKKLNGNKKKNCTMVIIDFVDEMSYIDIDEMIELQ